ncbi:aminopeptidase P family protein [Mesoplasma syrphidae]|uniref:Aminopeptidase P family protein n=1 Tax=Mesoplasma syrphidae TaxID=225999 RepID=A0A2K9BN74_9MOLU|nr:aminopeptidase P family protein [Mesoplasma syrphidae]AUF83493.1 aminopeptidase P family protein [Mesoplasma syrphidae]
MTKYEKIIKLLDSKQTDAVILYAPENRYWYSRFHSSMGYLIVTRKGSYLFLDGRYITAAKNKKDLQNVDHIIHFGKNVWAEMLKILEQDQVSTLGFESDWVMYKQYLGFKNNFANQTLVPIDCSSLRMEKELWEITQIKTACDITNTVFQEVLQFVKPGMTELELARFVSDRFFANGADKLSFDTIVASGVNGSMPHAVPTDKKLAIGELVTLDMGCFYNGYCSDQTRTFGIGEITDPKLLDIYKTVYEAQSLGISLVKAKQNAGDIHREVANFIAQAGYEGYFDHGLGHGIGVEIHEEPYENGVSQTILEANMTITVEPGIYIPGVGGVRIEDDLLVTSDGYEMLTTSPRELIIVK